MTSLVRSLRDDSGGNLNVFTVSDTLQVFICIYCIHTGQIAYVPSQILILMLLCVDPRLSKTTQV